MLGVALWSAASFAGCAPDTASTAGRALTTPPSSVLGTAGSSPVVGAAGTTAAPNTSLPVRAGNNTVMSGAAGTVATGTPAPNGSEPPRTGRAGAPAPIGTPMTTPAPAAGSGSAPNTTNMPAPVEACNGASTLMPGAQQSVMLADRKYLLRVGKMAPVGTAVPLVLNLHGLSMTPELEETLTGMTPVADSNGFVVAYPGFAPETAWDLTSTKDFDFMKAIIADVASKVCIDHKRIYAMGFSHGAFMSFAMGCKMSDMIAAIAPHSGAGGGLCNATRPVPVFAWHGDADNVVAYSGGQSAVMSWVTKDKCPSTPTTFMAAGANCQDWNPCDAGTEVKFCTVPGGGHNFTRGASPFIWDFFKQFSLP
jgi:poly(3-hydroxybutyrate) depolymerase